MLCFIDDIDVLFIVKSCEPGSAIAYLFIQLYVAKIISISCKISKKKQISFCYATDMKKERFSIYKVHIYSSWFASVP